MLFFKILNINDTAEISKRQRKKILNINDKDKILNTNDKYEILDKNDKDKIFYNIAIQLYGFIQLSSISPMAKKKSKMKNPFYNR